MTLQVCRKHIPMAPEKLYWDNQCKPCPAKLYEKDHCANGGVLVGERACKGVFCEGQCTVAVRSGAPAPDFYWDGQCTACPAKFYKDSHCLVVSSTSWIFNPTKAEHGASLKIG